LKSGLSKAGHVAESAAVKTWHLVLHIMLGSVWMVLGVILATLASIQYDKYCFRRALNSGHTGPVVLSKEFWVVGGSELQRKFNDYWANVAAPFMKAQPGVKMMRFGRGLDMSSNLYSVNTEFNSLAELRRMLDSPELEELKKRMPKATLSRHKIGLLVQQVKGPAYTSVMEGDRTQTGTTTGGEGLRQRGSGVSAGGPGH